MDEIRKLFPYIRRTLPSLLLALVLLVASGALETLTVMLLAPIFDSLSPVSGGEVTGGGKFRFLQTYLGLYFGAGIAKLAVLLAVLPFFKGVFLYFAEYSMSRSGQRVVANLRKDLYAHLLDQSLAFYACTSTGKLMVRVISDAERLQETVSRTLTDFLRQFFLLFFFLGLVFYTDWKLALLSLLIGPLVLAITLKLGRRIRSIRRRSQENLSKLSHALQETIIGQRIVKGFGMEDYERRRFNHSVDELMSVNLKAERITALSSPLIEFIGWVSFVPFLLYANYQINHGFTLGSFVVFIAALFRLYEPVRKLSRMHLYFQQAFASSARIFELLQTTIDLKDSPGAQNLECMEKEITFDRVSFRYGNDPVPVLEDIDLTIQRGEIVALVGSSGSGKTSLASLISRFYDVSSGAIRVDGRDIRDLTLQSLRSQIAIVTQDTFLFNDSIRNNIAYGREDCSLKEVVEAARAAFIDDFISTLPDGYDTLIGERGQRLSGGQRQRLAIARAVLKRAPILILDEATSALDSESENLVQQALYNLVQRCTTLVIAHRLSTVRQADRIVVLESGRIVEVGDHEKLVRHSGVYRKLYDLQFADTGLAS